MAMAVIKNGSKKMKVSYGAFVGMYKRAGWELANVSAVKKHGEGNKSSSDASDEQNQDAKQEKDEKDEWDEADEELAKETNVDKMDFNELRKLAVSKGINVKGIKTIGELRKAIKEVK